MILLVPIINESYIIKKIIFTEGKFAYVINISIKKISCGIFFIYIVFEIYNYKTNYKRKDNYC